MDIRALVTYVGKVGGHQSYAPLYAADKVVTSQRVHINFAYPINLIISAQSFPHSEFQPEVASPTFVNDFKVLTFRATCTCAFVCLLMFAAGHHSRECTRGSGQTSELEQRVVCDFRAPQNYCLLQHL